MKFDEVLFYIFENIEDYKNKILFFSLFIAIYESFNDNLDKYLISIICPIKEEVTNEELYDIKNCEEYKRIINKKYIVKDKKVKMKNKSIVKWFVNEGALKKIYRYI